MSIKVIRPGLLTTIQDLGRYGLQRYGVIVSGAMDTFSLRIANLLVGNNEGEAALEITLLGPKLIFEENCLISITGANLTPTIDGERIPLWRPIYVKQGSTIQFGNCVSGCRAYLAVAGGFDVPRVMGSRSTYIRASIGGFNGRALEANDVLKLGNPSELAVRLKERLSTKQGAESFISKHWRVSTDILPKYNAHTAIRVLPGAQFDAFTEKSRNKLLQGIFQVTTQSDRMGYRLAGPNLKLARTLEMISDVVSAGTVQVPPEGNPIVLMADRQTTGGYPKIAQIITVDLPVMAQVKPGETLEFKEISLEDAQMRYLIRERKIQRLKHSIALKVK